MFVQSSTQLNGKILIRWKRTTLLSDWIANRINFHSLFFQHSLKKGNQNLTPNAFKTFEFAHGRMSASIQKYFQLNYCFKEDHQTMMNFWNCEIQKCHKHIQRSLFILYMTGQWPHIYISSLNWNSAVNCIRQYLHIRISPELNCPFISRQTVQKGHMVEAFCLDNCGMWHARDGNVTIEEEMVVEIYSLDLV